MTSSVFSAGVLINAAAILAAREEAYGNPEAIAKAQGQMFTVVEHLATDALATKREPLRIMAAQKMGEILIGILHGKNFSATLDNAVAELAQIGALAKSFEEREQERKKAEALAAEREKAAETERLAFGQSESGQKHFDDTQREQIYSYDSEPVHAPSVIFRQPNYSAPETSSALKSAESALEAERQAHTERAAAEGADISASLEAAANAAAAGIRR